MITVAEWKVGLEAWEKVEKQATIDLEQAALYKEVIEKKIKELEEKNKLEVE